jgi:NitT/TauT family transport system ATP-binding protein
VNVMAMKRPASASVQQRSVVSLRDVTVDYGRRGEVRAIEAVNLEVRRGEFLAVVGPSGCGKSTLLRVVSGLLMPTGGRAEIDGLPIKGPRADVGVVFQDPTLLPWKSVRQNVMLPATVRHLDRRLAVSRAEALLKLVGLGDFGDRYPHELSGGMRQRAGIARALLNDPRILLMDEPFGALDAMTRERMNEEISRIWADSGTSVLFITHSIPEAVLLSDRIAVFSSRPGKVVEIIDNPLPRPRPLSIMATPEFGQLTAHLREYFRVTGAID